MKELISGLTAIRTALRNDQPLFETDWDRLLTETVEALSRLTVSPLPDNIAKLLALREGLPAGPWTVDNGEALCVRDPDGGRLLILSWLKGRHGLGGRRAESEVAALARAIAALPSLFAELEKMGREVERLNGEIQRDRVLFGGYESRIAELEDLLNRQKARTEEEAELRGNALNDLDSANACIRGLLAERDAIKAKTIKEIAALFEPPLGGWGQIDLRHAQARILALMPPEAEAEGE